MLLTGQFLKIGSSNAGSTFGNFIHKKTESWVRIACKEKKNWQISILLKNSLILIVLSKDAFGLLCRQLYHLFNINENILVPLFNINENILVPFLKKKKKPGKPQIEILYSQLTDCN